MSKFEKVNIWAEHHNTLRPFETLLFSELPIMIWQKNLQRLFSAVFLSNCKVQLWISIIWQVFFLFDHTTVKSNLQVHLEAKSMHGSSWKKNSIVSVFILVFAGQVLFTVNGLNWSQSWLVLVCLLRKNLNHWNTN